MLVFYSFVFIPLCCLLKLHALCFLKYFSSPIFVGSDEEYKSRSPRPGSAAASLLDSKPFPFAVSLFFILYCILTDQGGHILVLTAHLLSHSALVALCKNCLVHLTPGSLQSLLLASLASQFCHLALNCTWLFPKLLEEKMVEDEIEKKEDCLREGGHNLKLYTER